MHKFFILFVLSFLFIYPIQAQFKGGFYVGINGSQVDGDKLAGFYKLGANLSVAVEYPFAEHFGASMEISYTQKGSQTKWVQGIPRQFFLKLDYIEVPLMLNYHDNKKVTLSAGIGINSLVYVYKDDIIYSNPYWNYAYPDLIKNTDIELKAGGSYQLNKHWLINVLYSYSIIAMGRSVESIYLNGGVYNNLVSFRLGYLILGKADK